MRQLRRAARRAASPANSMLAWWYGQPNQWELAARERCKRCLGCSDVNSLECAAAARWQRLVSTSPDSRPSVDDTLVRLKRQPFYLVPIDTEGRGASKIPVTAARLTGGRPAPLASLRISSLQHSGASSLARGARQIAVQNSAQQWHSARNRSFAIVVQRRSRNVLARSASVAVASRAARRATSTVGDNRVVRLQTEDLRMSKR